MKKKGILVLFVILIVILSAYIKRYVYLPIEGTVIDAETKQPIQGAVVLADWTIKSWFPDGPTRVFKVFETVTDKNGRFKINVYILRPVSNSYLTIYKAGYVCWNNKFIFPEFSHREDFKWENNNKYELEKFKKEYSCTDHVSFIRYFVFSSTKMFENAYRWEEMREQKELRER